MFARARDSATVDVMVPYDFDGGVVEMMALIERVEVSPDSKARVVVNERTGTVVMGESVRLSTVAIAHGNLTLEIKPSASAVAPAPPADTAVRGPTSEKADADFLTETVKESPITMGESGDKVVYAGGCDPR